LAGETEVLGENLPQRHFCTSQNSTWPDPGLNPGRRGGKPETHWIWYIQMMNEIQNNAYWNDNESTGRQKVLF
jgi:hypothetical protein